MGFESYLYPTRPKTVVVHDSTPGIGNRYGCRGMDWNGSAAVSEDPSAEKSTASVARRGIPV